MSELKCNGQGHGCGRPPGKDGRIILSPRSGHLWVLCREHADYYAVNLEVVLNLGDVEVTEEDAEKMSDVGMVMSR